MNFSTTKILLKAIKVKYVNFNNYLKKIKSLAYNKIMKVKIKNIIDNDLVKIFGKESVLTSEPELFAYSHDCSNIKSENAHLPLAVVFPKDVYQVQKLVLLANERNLSIIARGVGTNHVGSCVCLADNTVIVSFVKMDRILKINRINLTVEVEPGVVVEDLQKELENQDLFFPPDPSNQKVSLVGGAIAQSAGGPRGFKYGTVKDYVLNLEVVLPNGEIIETGKNCHKNVEGYNLTQLFVGSEGTLGIITKATLKVIPKVEAKNVILVYFETIDEAANAVCSIISHHIVPSVLELMDKNTLETIERFKPSGLKTQFEACLLLEVDGFASTIVQQCETVKTLCLENNAKDVIISKNDEEKEKIWIARRSSFACCTKLAPNVIADDFVVSRELIPLAVKTIQNICNKHNIIVCIMGHIGDGNIHPNYALDLNDKNEIERFNACRKEIIYEIIKLKGSITGEHGIGIEKAKYIEKSVGSSNIKLMKLIKNVFDPKNIMNPHKIFE